MRRPRFLLLMLVLACARPAAEPLPPIRGVILVSIDTLRADRLGAYGYQRPTSPTLDELATQSILFSEAFAAAPSTLPSHATLFTGQRPDRHGASFARRRALDESAVTLADSFRAAGWQTAGFHNGAQMAPAFGIGQGFEIYERVRRPRLARVVRRGLEWLDRLPAGAPFFLFLHTYHVHAPYEPEPSDIAVFRDAAYDGRLPDRMPIKALEGHNQAGDLRPEDIAHVGALYDAGIRAMDRELGQLLEGLAARGRLDDVALMVVSDHGEELGERGWVGWHAYTLFDELLHVPVLLRLPEARGAGRRIDQQVGLVDVAPTLLELAGLPEPDAMDGASLVPLLSSDRGLDHREWVVSVRDEEGSPLRSVRTAHFKLIGDQLFDLAADPAESIDIAAREPEIVAELRGLLLEALAPSVEAGHAEIDDELRAELEALGYVGD